MMWWSIGSSLAGGTGDDWTSKGEGGFAGNGAFFLSTSSYNKSAYAKASWFFGWTFAGAGCTIVSGAIAERATFTAYSMAGGPSRGVNITNVSAEPAAELSSAKRRSPLKACRTPTHST